MSFDISQYNIEVTMDNEDETTDTALYTTIYPRLEDNATIVELRTGESSSVQDDGAEETEPLIVEEDADDEYEHPTTEGFDSEEAGSEEEPEPEAVEISNMATKVEEALSLENEPAQEAPTVRAQTLVVEFEDMVVEKDNELSLQKKEASAAQEVVIGEYSSTRAEPISLTISRRQTVEESVEQTVEAEALEEVVSVASLDDVEAFGRDDIISVKEESIPSNDGSIVFVNKFAIPEPSEDTEPWNRWLFTQLRHILETKTNKVAIVEEIGETRCITYGELMDGMMKMANYLKHHGVVEGTRVGFCMESCFEFILYELACFFLGALPILFHPSHIASDRVTRLNLKIMVVDADHYGHVLRAFEFFGDLEKIFILADDLTSIYIPKNVWIYDGLGFLDFKCDVNLQLGRAGSNVIAFATSGTSSTKGKIVAHSAQGCKSICTHYYTEITSLLKEKHPEETADVHLVSTGLHTIDGFSYSIYSLIHGGTLVLTETNADIWKVSFLDRVAGLIERYQIPMLMVHSQFLKCFSKYEIHKIYNVKSLKLLCHSGSCLSPAVIQHVRELGMSITQAYITTETGAFSLDEVTGSHDLTSTCGEPFLGNNVKILGLDEDAEVSPGKWGRLWVQGPTLFAEYLCEAKFAESCSGGWFFTGDLAAVDEQARLFVVGPIDGVYNGPDRIVPLVHAESILAEHPAIDDVAVCKLKEELVLGIVLTEGEVPPSVDQINSTLKNKKIKLQIDRVVVVDFVPRSETGKLLREDLPFLMELDPETEIDLDIKGGIETDGEFDIETVHAANESSI